MPAPIELRPATLGTLFENTPREETPLLDKYFPLVDSRFPGPIVMYDVIADSRVRPRVNTREGPADYVNGDELTVVRMVGETWRDGRRISPTTLKDLRRPGTPSQSRGRWQIVQDTNLLKRRWSRFVEWQASSGLRGVKSFRPPGMDLNDHFDELLLCSTDCLVDTVTAAWNAASATEAAARTNLGNIRTDFLAATTAISNAGGVAKEVLMNGTTLGYLDTQFLAAGYDATSDIVLLDGHVSRFAGLDIVTNDRTYIHPVDGSATNYVEDNVAIFLDPDNARAGRRMIQCEAVHVEAPDGHMGVFIHSFNELEAPGEVKISGEWTGAPAVVWPCRQYVYTDVTAAA